MKKLTLLTLLLGCMTATYGQVKKDVKEGLQKAGNKTEEVTSKAKAKIVDKVHADKVGPDGQTIYIDKHAKYYWIDKKGDKNFVQAADLKDKPRKQK